MPSSDIKKALDILAKIKATAGLQFHEVTAMEFAIKVLTNAVKELDDEDL